MSKVFVGMSENSTDQDLDQCLCLPKHLTLPCTESSDPLSLLFSHQVVSDSPRPPGLQHVRLPCPWDSPGKNTGVGCHFLLQCVKVKSESEVDQSCIHSSTLLDPMDCSLPGSSAHGIIQARVLEWVAIAFSTRGFSSTAIPKHQFFSVQTFLWSNFHIRT